jgi:methyl-accepting chemotaxis protein
VRLQLSHKLILAFLLLASAAAGASPFLARFGISVWAALAVALTVGAALGWLIAEHITRGFGGIGEQIQRAAEQMTQASGELSRSAENLSGTSEEIAGTTELVAQGAVRQQEDVNAGSKRVRELSGAIRSSAEAAHAAFGFVTESSQRADAGLEAARHTTTKMQSMFEQVEQAGHLVFRFDEKIRSVRHVTEMITSVAEKTHLLSLNASIEAAAESATSSAERIDLLIQEVEDEAARISEVMRELGQGVGEGREQLDRILRSLEQIQIATQEAARRSEGIFDPADGQVGHTEDVLADIDRVAAVVSENVRATETIRKELAMQTKLLEELLGQTAELAQVSAQLDEFARRLRAL